MSEVYLVRTENAQGDHLAIRIFTQQSLAEEYMKQALPDGQFFKFWKREAIAEAYSQLARKEQKA